MRDCRGPEPGPAGEPPRDARSRGGRVSEAGNGPVRRGHGPGDRRRRVHRDRDLPGARRLASTASSRSTTCTRRCTSAARPARRAGPPGRARGRRRHRGRRPGTRCSRASARRRRPPRGRDRHRASRSRSRPGTRRSTWSARPRCSTRYAPRHAAAPGRPVQSPRRLRRGRLAPDRRRRGGVPRPAHQAVARGRRSGTSRAPSRSRCRR